MPLLSYNCAAQKYARCRETVHKSPLISASLMLVGAACFILLPGALLAWFIGWKGTKGRCLPAALVGAVVYLACEGSTFLPVHSYSFDFLMLCLGTFGLGAALGFLAAWGMGRIKGNPSENGKET